MAQKSLPGLCWWELGSAEDGRELFEEAFSAPRSSLYIFLRWQSFVGVYLGVNLLNLHSAPTIATSLRCQDPASCREAACGTWPTVIKIYF